MAPAAMPGCFVVSGAGSPQANGVYQRLEGTVFEGCPVYESLGSYCMSVTRRPEEGSGRMLWGWVIGRKHKDGPGPMPVYACPTDVKTEIPEDGWQCFQGRDPGPEVHALEGGDGGDGLAEAYAREAQSAAITSDLRRASEAFARALRSGPALAANWGRRAELHAARAKVSHMREKFDLALRDADAALRLRVDFAPALLLRAQVLRETREVYDAALSAKQCWLLLRQEVEEGCLAKGLERALRECEKLLLELGERLDGSLPRAREGGGERSEEAAAEEEPEPQATERVLSVEVSGCGTTECRGVYEPTSSESNGEPIFENIHGFNLSLEVLPVKGTQEAKYGWVIGRGRQGYYGVRSAAEASRRPPGGGWRSFGRGELPLPSCRVRSAPSGALALEGRKALRQQRPTEAAEVLSQALEQPGAAASILGRAALLSDLAEALRESGELDAARDRAREASSIWPRQEEAFLEEARILEAAGESAEAAEALQRLLTMRPSHDRAAVQLLRLAGQASSAQEWLRRNQAIGALAVASSPTVAEERPQEQLDKEADEQARRKLFQELEQLRAQKAPQVFENKDSEVHASWTLPSKELGAGDLEVEMKAQHLSISVRGVAIFDEDLANRIKPSESSWAYTAPELTMVLCKCMDRGAWPKWETLQRETLAEREARLAGLPFDRKDLIWT